MKNETWVPSVPKCQVFGSLVAAVGTREAMKMVAECADVESLDEAERSEQMLSGRSAVLEAIRRKRREVVSLKKGA